MRSFSTFLITVAAIALLISALLYLSPWRKELYEEYAVREMVPPDRRETVADSLLAVATRHFNHHKYEKAAAELDKVVALEPDMEYARYYRGLAQLENNRLAEARADLEALWNEGSPYKHSCAFFIALSYLKGKNGAEARVWLNRIPEGTPEYPKAQRLLQEMK